MNCCAYECHQGRDCPARASRQPRIELPQPTEPVGELDQWAARLSRRAVFFLLALAAGAFVIGYFSR